MDALKDPHLAQHCGICTKMIYRLNEIAKLNMYADDHQAPVVQTMDSAVHRINYYPADKHSQNQLSYPVDSDLSRG